LIYCLSDDTVVLINTITASADFIVAILGLYFPRMQSVPSTNVDEDESAFVALRLRLATAANEDR
jgi:hypothetical protein